MSEVTRELFDTLAKVLLRCWLIGIVLMLLTLGGVLLMGDAVHDMHRAMFGLSNHESDMISLGYLALIKLCVSVFFFVPWLAIRLVLRTTKN